MKIDEEFGVSLGGIVIKQVKEVKILGYTVDRHLTGSSHIEKNITKCHGLLHVLRRAGKSLPESLTKLVYTSIIRSQMEYASTITHSASQTNLLKLDVIQRTASRIITNSSSRAHAAPLMIKLGLEDLSERRKKKIVGLVEDMLDGHSHPYFEDFFGNSEQDQLNPGNYGYNRKRFSTYGLQIYKETKSNDRASARTAVQVMGPALQTNATSHTFEQQTSDTAHREDYPVNEARLDQAV